MKNIESKFKKKLGNIEGTENLHKTVKNSFK